MALRYVERFATTRGRLVEYLRRKIRERGWDGEPADPVAIGERMAGLGYIDDRAFAEARAAAMARRGLGARRVADEFRASGIDGADIAALTPDVDARSCRAALTFARRKRIGPYGNTVVDRPAREKQIAAMLRAGHGFALARRIAAMEPDVDFDPDVFCDGADA
ncbi:RecX family transcriptional regulator [Sphingomonas sp. Leaf17]|nr:RecX family transcriptional regulator [Sphingomonas sp. Leaf17]